VAVALIVHPQRVAQLSHGEQKRRGRHETDDDRLGDITGQVTQLEQADHDLEYANQDGQHEQRLEEFLGVLRIDEGKRRETSSDMALVGPLIRCDDDPKIEATIVTTIAEYTPNRGSTPSAISAYAMACGSEMAATGEAGNDIVPAFDQVVIQMQGSHVC